MKKFKNRKEEARYLVDVVTIEKNLKFINDHQSTENLKKALKALNVSKKNYEEWKEQQDRKNHIEKIKGYVKKWVSNWKNNRGDCLAEMKEVDENSKVYTLQELKSWVSDEIKKKKEEQLEEDYEVMTRRGQIEEFWKNQPFYYDESRIFWLWDKENFKWVISDEVNFCNSIFKIKKIDTIDYKTRGEAIEGFKQIGRLHKPKDVEKSWVQFKEKIYDVKTGKSFKASPEYFVTNPIPWNVGKSEETPTIDKYFDDWIKGQDKSWKDTLYEIIAYNICMDKFMQRIIALVGGGSNGKGTYIKLNYKFLGEENCVSTEIKTLTENVFEPAVLFRKLLFVMGEVSYDDLRNTNQLKKLGGEDKISFQFKGKTPFTADNTATGICLTNSMPITPDKTQGFYRKWLIVDFLNQFKNIDSDLIDTIPDIEFENLAKKSLRILKEIYDKPHFTNEGDFEERARRYEERSNPVMKFVEEGCIENDGEMIPLRDFTNACNEYLKNKHLRIMNPNQIGKVLRDEGFVVGPRKINNINSRVILNLKLSTHKNYPNYPNYPKPILPPYIAPISNKGSNGSSSSFTHKKKKIKIIKPQDFNK